VSRINDLLAMYRELHDNRRAEIARLKDQLLDLEEPLQEIENEIKATVLEAGESAEHLGVKATYRSGYDRVSYDSKALDGYAAAHPEVLAFRKATQCRPSVSVKVT